MPLTPPITLHNLSFSWPTGERALTNLEGTFPSGRTGLTGANGSGKSTLLKLIAGQLSPSEGRVEAAEELAYLPQTLTLHRDTTVTELLGIDRTYRALKAIEAGSVDPEDFDAVGDNWDLEARLEAELSPLGLGTLDLDRQVGTLSGGEAMLLAVLGLRLAALPITLLDEPTNNLDAPTRELLYGLVRSWKGTLIVVSHDIEMLELMDHTVELYAGKLRVFGGPYSAYREQLETEQHAAEQAAKTASASLKVEKRQRVEAETKLARAKRKGRAEQLGGGIPKILANHLRQKSEANAGKMRSNLDGKVDSAQTKLDRAEERVRQVEHINLELPDPKLPASKQVAQLSSAAGKHIIQGPERVALIGPNGSGKTTLLRQLLFGDDAGAGPSGRLYLERVGYLPQLLVGLDEDRSAIENIGEVAPSAAPGQVRNMLARLLLRGASVDRPLSALSGGERFRVYLASLLLSEPPVQLLILDEPTNNLDLESVRQLCEALALYRGALLVVSHDQHFLDKLNLDYQLELSAEGTMTKSYPTPVR
ncbi:ABC transporter [Arthrobacter sp. MYb229]|uniref:ABC-F family ATP-binding cassette domain-containing protein n=1 Tax=unclassified Arthrobacter TaxID=235627 RepID=UPI000CFD9CB6|nr:MULTISPECIES: ABC-F family ATP-binding cassette domain-containing protein [unclassified Arthrobacter]PRA03263.1 ABC transporter [Arthrobacter sp. MYb229]PRB49734.1 ABC transporter [Arthrobacter sp. MYb216]